MAATNQGRAYVGLHCIRHVERSFQLSCYTLENIYKYLAPRSRRSREIHSAQKSKRGWVAGTWNKPNGLRTHIKMCSCSRGREVCGVDLLAGWRSIPIRALPVSLSLTFCASKLFFPAAIIGREKEPSETRAHVERERERERQGQGGALHLFAINTLFWRRWVYELRQSGMSRRRAAFVHSRRRSQPPRPSRPQVKRFRQAAWRPL